MTSRLAWVTAALARGLDDDEPLALPALAAAGAHVDVVEWSDPQVDWGSYDVVLLRSPWDYPERFDEFVGWLSRAAGASRLVNPLPMVQWSLDKHYLLELAAAGLPIVPTAIAEPAGDQWNLPAGDVVVKPAVGAGSRDAAWYAGGDSSAALSHVARLQSEGRAVLMQPFLRRVAREGESALLFFAGEFSHSVVKRVALPEASLLTVEEYAEHLTPHEPTAAELALARDVIAFVRQRFGTPAYARVDVVRDDADVLRVLEVELAEPSLFLPVGGPAAVARLVAAVLGGS